MQQMTHKAAKTPSRDAPRRLVWDVPGMSNRDVTGISDWDVPEMVKQDVEGTFWGRPRDVLGINICWLGFYG